MKRHRPLVPPWAGSMRKPVALLANYSGFAFTCRKDHVHQGLHLFWVDIRLCRSACRPVGTQFRGSCGGCCGRTRRFRVCPFSFFFLHWRSWLLLFQPLLDDLLPLHLPGRLVTPVARCWENHWVLKHSFLLTSLVVQFISMMI